MSKICEVCRQRAGTGNSMFIKDETDTVGVWICAECEQEAEEDYGPCRRCGLPWQLCSCEEEL